MGQRAFYFQGPREWNRLADNILRTLKKVIVLNILFLVICFVQNNFEYLLILINYCKLVFLIPNVLWYSVEGSLNRVCMFIYVWKSLNSSECESALMIWWKQLPLTQMLFSCYLVIVKGRAKFTTFWTTWVWSFSDSMLLCLTAIFRRNFNF